MSFIGILKVKYRVSLGARFLHDACRGCTRIHLPATISETEIAHTTTVTRLAHCRLVVKKFFPSSRRTRERKKRKGRKLGKQDIRSLKVESTLIQKCFPIEWQCLSGSFNFVLIPAALFLIFLQPQTVFIILSLLFFFNHL